jgi:hypothetical protein
MDNIFLHNKSPELEASFCTHILSMIYITSMSFNQIQSVIYVYHLRKLSFAHWYVILDISVQNPTSSSLNKCCYMSDETGL